MPGRKRTAVRRPLKPFTSVTYAGLWDGVTAVYEAQAGAILKSTYYVDAGLTATPPIKSACTITAT